MNIQSTQAAPVADHRPFTEIAVILDRSGSMETIATDAIGGFNAFLASQRDFVPPAATPAATAGPGERAEHSPAPENVGPATAKSQPSASAPDGARLTLVLFDDRYEVPIKSTPLDKVPLLTRESYIPRSRTALLDAIGRTIKKMTESFAARPPGRRPAKIIVAILTDGLENASRQFTHAHIADLIAEKRAQSWEFVFLAANQDAIAEAARLSIPSADSLGFATTPDGMLEGFRNFDGLVRQKRGK